MSESATVTAPVETVVAPVKASKPKAKKVVKAKAKKAAKPAKVAKEPRAAKPRKMQAAQVRILKLLSKKPQTRAQVIEKAKFDPTWYGEYVGSRKGVDAWKKAAARIGFECLLLQKLVKAITVDVDGKSDTVLEITATGRKALEKAEK